jgi:two-component system sensor histidine kinase HydH
MVKISKVTSSLAAAFLGWALLSALTIFVFWGLRDRARLIRDNDNERILNALFTSRGFDDFGSAIEANPVLEERIAGFAIYGKDLSPVYRWGETPPVFDEGILAQGAGGTDGNASRDRFGRYTIPDRHGRRIKFVIHTGRMFMSPPPNNNANPPAERMPQRDRRMVQRSPPQPNNPPRENDQGVSLFFNSPAGSDYFYIDISHPAYWRTRTMTAVLFPLCELILLALVFYIRHLYLRNREYRERIEAQKNLVVLGTAAGTLAHEIKNPLLSIRLQTGILEKIDGEKAGGEIRRINEEVDRISALVYRVNDFLRDAAGNRIRINVYDMLAEVSQRMCGRNIINDVSIRDAVILADTDRLRSVFENIIRNALESGGPPEEISASIVRGAGRSNFAGRDGSAGRSNSTGRSIIISIIDRGKGIGENDLKRVFDPFFTSKSTGTGIGLSISKRFVEAAGGSIELNNRDGGSAGSMDGGTSGIDGGAEAVLIFSEDRDSD